MLRLILSKSCSDGDHYPYPQASFLFLNTEYMLIAHVKSTTVLCNQLASIAVAPFTVSVTFSLFSVGAGAAVLGLVAFFLIALLRIQ